MPIVFVLGLFMSIIIMKMVGAVYSTQVATAMGLFAALTIGPFIPGINILVRTAYWLFAMMFVHAVLTHMGIEETRAVMASLIACLIGLCSPVYTFTVTPVAVTAFILATSL